MKITHHKDQAVNAETELTYIRLRNCADSRSHTAEFTLDSRNKAALSVCAAEGTWSKAAQISLDQSWVNVLLGIIKSKAPVIWREQRQF